MTRWAFVFPGQGAQKVGMGKSLVENSQAAREVFEEASDALSMDMQALCFDGPEETLRLTENTQPAILTVSIAAYRAFSEEVGLAPSCLAGHSLGEYAALVAAGVFSFKDAVYAVKQRGKFMQEAVPVGVGAMAAVLGLPREKVVEICEKAAEGEVVDPANFNSPGQVVISGHKGAVERAGELAREAGAKKVVPLSVSAPFHSTLMTRAGERLKEVLDTFNIGKMSIPVVANVTGKPYESEDEVVPMLVKQVSSPVYWDQTMETVRDLGVDRVIELGPGKVLSGLFKRFDRAFAPVSIQTFEDVIKFKESLGG
ncbi:MAG: [acyl-carrier-protein] S-malonyltransferase [Deltaproteobacteria bacterium]|nr:MAG: [acyl-carrier-protein] S-malonyltransferase [Deltaproteobacteria bacterium]